MKDFHEFRNSLTEAKKKPAKRNGEDYTDEMVEGEFRALSDYDRSRSMTCYIKISDIKKLNKNSVKKMSDEKREEMYDLLQDDYELLDDLHAAYANESMNQQDWLDDAEPSQKKYVRQDIKYLEKTVSKIKGHMKLILKHEQFL